MLQKLVAISFLIATLIGCDRSPPIERRLVLSELESPVPSTRNDERLSHRVGRADDTPPAAINRPAEEIDNALAKRMAMVPQPVVPLFADNKFDELKSSKIRGSQNNPQILNRPLFDIRSAEVTSHPLAGTWRSSACGSIFRIVDQGARLHITLSHSDTIRSGEAVLQLDGHQYSGTATFVLADDPTQRRRGAPLSIEVENSDRLSARTDFIYWAQNGYEVRRSPIQFYFHKLY